MPDYLLKLIEYKLEKEGLLDGSGADGKIRKDRSAGAGKKKEKAAMEMPQAAEILEEAEEKAEDTAFAENEDYEDTMSWLD